MSANPGRFAATEVLRRIAESGAWAAPALSAELSRAPMDSRDRALATEIVYGTLRVLPEVDEAYGAFLRAPAEQLDPIVRAAFRTGAYQLLHLSAPVHAIVSDTVSIVRGLRGPKLAGLVNAIMRKVAAKRPDAPAPADRLMLPSWLADKLVSELGAERAAAFLAARPLPPPVGLRARQGERDEVLEAVRAARPDAEVSPGDVSKVAIIARRVGDPRALGVYVDGRVAIQEQGAQLVGLLVGAESGERVADACAGRGGKTVQLAEAVGADGELAALDLHESKLERISEELERLRIATFVDTHPVDLSVGTGGLDERFDRVLVDAPCTGIGTLHRRPEILLRTTAKDPARMAELQTKILENACRLAVPGGIITYAVCSPTREEGIGVVEAVLEAHPELVEAMGDDPWPDTSISPDADGMIRIGPWDGDCDAYQVGRLRRSR